MPTGDVGHERKSTGDTLLDGILHGGVPQGALTLLLGPSGSGKSLLAHQIARLAAPHELYALAYGVPAAALRARHVAPAPEYLELSTLLHQDTFETAWTALTAAVDARSAQVVVVDTLDGLMVGTADETERRSRLDALNHLAWTRQAAVVLTLHPGRQCESLALASCALALKLDTADGGRQRTLTVEKFEGSAHQAGTHLLRVGPRGLSLAMDPRGSAEPPVSGLAARILGAFRTARSLTVLELTDLLGQEQQIVEVTLATLVRDGLLETSDSETAGLPLYRILSPGD